MIASVLRKAFGTRNTREFKRMERVVARINALEDEMRASSDAGLTTASRGSESSGGSWRSYVRRLRQVG